MRWDGYRILGLAEFGVEPDSQHYLEEFPLSKGWSAGRRRVRRALTMGR